MPFRFVNVRFGDVGERNHDFLPDGRRIGIVPVDAGGVSSLDGRIHMIVD